MSSVFADTALIPETPTIPTTSATTAATSTAPVTFVATRRSASHRARTLPSLGADLVGTSGADDGMTRLHIPDGVSASTPGRWALEKTSRCARLRATPDRKIKEDVRDNAPAVHVGSDG